MNAQYIMQEVSSVASTVNVVALAIGYYFMAKLYREWVVQGREERTAGGRPQVVVTTGHGNPPNV